MKENKDINNSVNFFKNKNLEGTTLNIIHTIEVNNKFVIL